MVTPEDIQAVRAILKAVQDRPKDVVFSYNGVSDTLFVSLTPPPFRGTSFLVDDPHDSVYLRIDESSGTPVGLQIEGFAIGFVFRHPEFADVLEIANLRGIDREAALAIMADAKQRGPKVATVTHFLEQLIAD